MCLRKLAHVLLLTLAVCATAVSPVWASPAAASDDGPYFPQTGYKVRNAVFLDFFDRRGGIRTFGYPVSREFTLYGFRVQFFQREVMQLRPDGSATTLNLLDAGLMPYTQIDGAVFPAADPGIYSQAPAPGSPGYASGILAYTRASAPDSWLSLPVGFYRTFLNTVRTADAFPSGKGSPALLPGFDLELWGVPTSAPAFDPHNHAFVYQRFQRGIMHYNQTSGTTQGLLLADYLKSIITGQNLPPDLEAQSRASPLYRQYDPRMPGWIARPAELPGSDLTMAFEPEPLIAVDPGHGGAEVGASFTFPDGSVLKEKDLTLRVANRVTALLREAGYTVVQTRLTDSEVNTAGLDLTGDGKVDLADELQARIDIANSARATLFLSIHFNGLGDQTVRGTEVYYCRARPFAAQSERFALLVQRSLTSELRAAGYDDVDRGIKDDEMSVGVGNHLYLLGPAAHRPSQMPGVLAEGLFLTNPADAARLPDPRLIETIARGYAKGVMAYYGR
jgi:N-acetylmuramoyl-L-alanine amidase